MLTFNNIYRPLTARPFLADDTYREYSPCVSLAPYVACYWTEGDYIPMDRRQNGSHNYEGNSREVLVIPDTCMDIIVNVNHTSQKISGYLCGIQDKPFLAQQFILRAKALAGYERDGKCCPYDYPTQRQMLMKALDMTHPNFDLGKFERCLLSVEDVKSLNQIAITYSETGERRFAIRIYEQLLRYTKRRLFNNEALFSVLPMLCYNYSRLLGRERRYEECIEIAQYGYDLSLKYDKARALGGLLLNIGCSLQKLGKDEEAKKKLMESYYAFVTVKKFNSAQKVKDYMKEVFEIEFKGDI